MGLWANATGRLKLEPIFGAKTFGANTTCDDIHHGPIPDGDRVCCMTCYGTGVPDHPDLKETAADKLKVLAWTPEGGRDPWSAADTAEPTRYEPTSASKNETRKEKRAKDWANANRPRMIVMDPHRIEHLVDEGRAIPASMIEAGP